MTGSIPSQGLTYVCSLACSLNTPSGSSSRSSAGPGPVCGTPGAADRWTWIVIACYAQLRLARPLAADLRLPWERPAPPGRLSPPGSAAGFGASTRPCPAQPVRRNPANPDPDARQGREPPPGHPPRRGEDGQARRTPKAPRERSRLNNKLRACLRTGHRPRLGRIWMFWDGARRVAVIMKGAPGNRSGVESSAIPGALDGVVPCPPMTHLHQPGHRGGVPVLPGGVPQHPRAPLPLGHERRGMGGHRAVTARAGLAGRAGRLARHLLPARHRRRDPLPDPQRAGVAGAAR